MINRKRIQIIANPQYGAHRHLITGIAEYAHTVTDWELEIHHPDEKLEDSIPDKDISGFISPKSYPTSQWLKNLQKSKIPLVFYGNKVETKEGKDFSQFYPDETVIGQYAADHLISKGFSNFAYIDHSLWPCSRERGESFRKHLQLQGHDCTCFSFGGNAPERAAFINWGKEKKSGPKAVFCVTDIVANSILRLARKSEIQCPFEIALLSVDNDELLCNVSSPPVSSIETDWRGMGYAAAAHLDALIDRHEINHIHQPWPATKVVERASSEFLGVSDKIVNNALSFIQRNIKSPITTAHVLSALHISRPTLDNRFKHILQRTVAEEITRMRLEKAKNLLKTTNMTIDAIAQECGFANPNRLYRIFNRHQGLTPGEYRQSQLKK